MPSRPPDFVAALFTAFMRPSSSTPSSQDAARPPLDSEHSFKGPHHLQGFTLPNSEVYIISMASPLADHFFFWVIFILYS